MNKLRIDSEKDLQSAESNGLLTEGHRLEFKSSLPSTKGTNKEVAKDLSSLSVDGGFYVIGVADEKDRPPALCPFDTTGLAERIDQITSTRVDPPLFVEVKALPSDQAGGKGYVIVAVPPSSEAPHMVEGKYWGRDDKTKRILTDREVQSLIERRQRYIESAEKELEAYVDRDPVQNGELAHYFAVAVPLGATGRDLLRRSDLGADPWAALRRMLKSRRGQPLFSPSFANAGHTGTRPDGWALASTGSLAGPRLVDVGEGGQDQEPSLLEVEFSHDGILRAYHSGVTRDARQYGYMIADNLAAGMTVGLVATAADVGTQIGYQGTWALGLAIRGPMIGMSASSAVQNFMGLASRYSANEFVRYTQASTVELTQEPIEVAERLIGAFLMALGLDPTQKIRDNI